MIPTYRTQSGFTLIEIIVSFVIFSVFANMLFQYMYSITKSNTPITQLQNVWSLQQSMDNIVVDYNTGIAACSPSCTSAVLTTLQANVTASVYGTYTIQTNGCITLTSGIETSSNCTSSNALLKVVIQDNATGATLCGLFTY
jgi:prepilin-type N-terminal cleavage/methylation domain-containing protein